MNIEDRTELKFKWNQIIFLAIFTVILLLVAVFLLDTDANEGLYSENIIIYTIFNIITEAGSEYFYIVFFAFAYIAWDKEIVQKIMINFTIVTHFTTFFKLVFQDPRPSTNEVNGEENATGYGFPSGHTTGTVSVWSLVYLNFNEEKNSKYRYIGKGLALFFLITVPLSRMIIGVHDLEDVVGGFLLSILLTVAFIIFYPPIKTHINKIDFSKRVVFLILFVLLFWLLSVSGLALLHPDKWEEQAIEMAQTGGMLLGLAIGIPIEREFVKYDPKHFSPMNRILGGIISIIITFGLYFILSILLKSLPLQFVFRGLRYCLLTGTLACGLPWLIQKMFPKTSIQEI